MTSPSGRTPLPCRIVRTRHLGREGRLACSCSTPYLIVTRDYEFRRTLRGLYCFFGREALLQSYVRLEEAGSGLAKLCGLRKRRIIRRGTGSVFVSHKEVLSRQKAVIPRSRMMGFEYTEMEILTDKTK